MSTTVKTFRNRENYAKYLALYFEPGVKVLLTTLEWCYKGQLPIEKHLAELGATNSLRKTNIINANEQNTFVELKEGKTELNNLDITILYKVIQLTCELLPRNNNVWTKDCPAPQQGELEFLLFRLKDGRNKLAHPRDELKNITDSMVEDKCKEIKDLLTKILQAAAFKGRKPPVKLREVLVHIQDDVQRISSGDNVCDSMRPHTINLILADLKSKAFSKDKLKSSLMNEIKKYSAPSLKSNDDLHPLKDILQLNNSSVIVVQGEAGRGKTTMSRFIYYSWMSGNTNPVEGLSSFDIVLRVECNRIFSSDINLFYETLFPNASFTFPNTVSLKKSLDKFRVFWIMDGFDECAAEFKCFLKAMTDSLSKKHKLLITTRPNTYSDLKDILQGKLSMTSLTLRLFQDHNVEEIIQSLIIGDENKEAFKTRYNSLDSDAKYLLSNPLNLNLYIKLWIQDPKLILDTCTTKMLFLKTTYNNLLLLKKRLYLSASLSKEDLEGYVDDWFYGSLCKQSFLMLMDWGYHIIGTKFLKILKKDARDSKLTPSTCLSTFLVKEKENDDESDEENEGESETENYWRSNKKKEGEIRYKYHHLTQQLILASLFLKHFKDNDGERVICKSINKILLFKSSIHVFYVEMINEDGSLDSDFEELFSPIQLITTSLPNFYDKQRVLFSTSVAVNLNAKYMEKVSQAFKEVLCLTINGRHILEEVSFSITVFIKFLEIVQPQKTLITNLYELSWKEGFQFLIDYLIKCEIEINLDYYILHDISVSSLFGTDLNVTALRDNRKKYVKYIQKGRESRDLEEFSSFCKSLWLPENQAFDQLEIWINFNSNYKFTDCNVNIVSLPRDIVKITILAIDGYDFTDKEDFERFLEFLTKIKDDKTLKFQALHLPYCFTYREGYEKYTFYEFLTKDKRLLEIAHSVSNDSHFLWWKPCFERFNDANLNLTAFEGPLETLDLLSNHHANLKTISIILESEYEIFRMLTFLHNNKTRLSEVKLDFSHFKFDKIRAFGFDFTIPKELVKHTSIKMRIGHYEEGFKKQFAILKDLKGDETLKFKALGNSRENNFTEEQQKMLLDQITCNLINNLFLPRQIFF